MEEAFDVIMASEDTVEVKAAGITHGGALRGIMGELKAGGMGIGQIIALIPVIVDMIQTYGPVVMEIVQKIREMFSKK